MVSIRYLSTLNAKDVLVVINTLKHGGYKFIFWTGACNCYVDSQRDNTPHYSNGHNIQYANETIYTLVDVLDQYIEWKTSILYWSIHYKGIHLLSVKDDY